MGERPYAAELPLARGMRLSHAISPRRESTGQQPLLRTLLVTDLEGFTPMLWALGDLAAREIIALHDSMLRECLKQYRGVERAHTGDGLITSFIDPASALCCAAAIQRKLRRYNQHAPKSAAINVRMAIHSGRTLIHDTRVFGAAVNTTVRLCAAAAPGEVIISEAARALVCTDSWMLRDLGFLALKGLPIPVHAFALDWRRLGNQDDQRNQSARPSRAMRGLADVIPSEAEAHA